MQERERHVLQVELLVLALLLGGHCSVYWKRILEGRVGSIPYRWRKAHTLSHNRDRYKTFKGSSTTNGQEGRQTTQAQKSTAKQAEKR